MLQKGAALKVSQNDQGVGQQGENKKKGWACRPTPTMQNLLRERCKPDLGAKEKKGAALGKDILAKGDLTKCPVGDQSGNPKKNFPLQIGGTRPQYGLATD